MDYTVTIFNRWLHSKAVMLFAFVSICNVVIAQNRNQEVIEKTDEVFVNFDLRIVSGNEQVCSKGQPADELLTVQLIYKNGAPVQEAGLEIMFKILKVPQGSENHRLESSDPVRNSVEELMAFTDANGYASVRFVAGTFTSTQDKSDHGLYLITAYTDPVKYGYAKAVYFNVYGDLKIDLQASDISGPVDEIYEHMSGAYIHFNIDDDNKNLKEDYKDSDTNDGTNVIKDDDLYSLTCMVPKLKKGYIKFSGSNGHIKLWKILPKALAMRFLQAEMKDFFPLN